MESEKDKKKQREYTGIILIPIPTVKNKSTLSLILKSISIWH